MPPPGEIIGLHFGGYASYVGAHLWNFQDELLGLDSLNQAVSGVNADVLFRCVDSGRGQPHWTPRALVVDMDGSLGGLNLADDFEDEAQAFSSISSQWGSQAVEVYRQAPIAQSTFAQQLEQELEDADMDEDSEAADALQQAARDLDADPSGPRFWTDFLKANLQPRAVLLLPQPWAGGDESSGSRPLGWGEAQSLVQGARAEELADRVRRLAEECDRLQGLQVLVESDGGFGGAAAHALTELRDDFPRAPVLLFALQQSALPPARLPGQDQAAHIMAHRQWQLACSLSLAHLAPLSSLYVPLAVPPSPPVGSHLEWQPHNRFHTSALCAALCDSASLPYRMDAGGGIGAQDLHSIANLLAPNPHGNIAAFAAALPAPGLPPASAHAAADGRAPEPAHADPFTLSGVHCWSPGLSHEALREALLAESIVLRGARASSEAAPVALASAALDASLMTEGVRCVRHRCLSPQPLPLPLPFPRTFGPLVQRFGDTLPPPQAPPALPNGALPPWQDPPAPAHAQAQPPLMNGHVDVVSAPVLTRLISSQSTAELASQQLQQFHGAVRSVAGRQLWRSWDWDQQGIEDAQERLHALATAYDATDG